MTHLQFKESPRLSALSRCFFVIKLKSIKLDNINGGDIRREGKLGG